MLLTFNEFICAPQVAGLVIAILLAMEKGYILHPYKAWLEKQVFYGRIPQRLADPLGLCERCFSVWAGAPFAFAIIAWPAVALPGYNPAAIAWIMPKVAVFLALVMIFSEFKALLIWLWRLNG